MTYLLLENQIPFFIVQSLFELSKIPGLHTSLNLLAISYVTRGNSQSVPVTILDPKDVHHLLHLSNLSFLRTPSHRIMTARSHRHLVMSTIKKLGSLASGSFFWLSSSFLCCRLPLERLECHQQLTDEERLRTPRTIPNATELEGSGVEFKRKEATSLLETNFKDGVMEIPFLSTGDSIAPRFRNLIAFEQCCPVSRSPFSSYATLLDNLIDKPKNVAILKEHGIIEMRKYLTCSIAFAKVHI